jgi:hypothetical protein
MGSPLAERAKRVARIVFLLPLTVYRYVISPLLPRSCIYEPTCSHYVHTAVHQHGILKGTALGFFRITRCVGGLFTGGVDPVPEHFSTKESFARYREFWNGKKVDTS